MFRKIGIPIMAVLGLFLATIVMVISMQRPPVPPIENPPPKPPFPHYVAGSGIIEASSPNINVATAIAGIIEEMYVEPGDRVKKGDPLFRVNTRDLIATVQETQATRKIRTCSNQSRFSPSQRRCLDRRCENCQSTNRRGWCTGQFCNDQP